MASNKKLKISAHQTFINVHESEPSVLNMTNEEIKEKICATHTHSDRDINVASLFAVVRNILNPAIVAVENIVMVYICIYMLQLTTSHSSSYKFLYFVPFLCNFLLLLLHWDTYIVRSLGYSIVVTLPLTINLLVQKLFDLQKFWTFPFWNDKETSIRI